MNFTMILVIALALAGAGDIIIGKLYLGAKEDIARIQQAYDSFKAQVKVEGEAAQKKADAIKVAQDNATKEVSANDKKYRDRLTAYYERRLLDSASSSSAGGSMPAPTVNPGGTDAAPAEQVASGPGFELACARDAQQVMQFQAWAVKQGIPIAQ